MEVVTIHTQAGEPKAPGPCLMVPGLASPKKAAEEEEEEEARKQREQPGGRQRGGKSPPLWAAEELRHLAGAGREAQQRRCDSVNPETPRDLRPRCLRNK